MKRLRMKSLCTVLAVASVTISYGQQHPIFTQYMFNGLVINPAYAGTHESTTLTASIRNQWTGIADAPQTQVLSVHSPVRFSRSAIGGLAVHDRVGVTNHYMMYGVYAYHIPVSRKAQISVGGQAGFTYYKSDYTKLNVVTNTGNNDDVAFAATENKFLPNIGIGAYYYSDKAYVGLSIPEIVNNPWSREASLKSRQERHYFLSAGYVWTLNRDLKLKPNVLLKFMEGGPFQIDINANLLIKELVWVGVSYRSQDSVDGLLQYMVNDQFSVGYSYGYPVNSLASLQSGTHEVVLNYRLKKSKNIVLSPRYF